MGKYQKNRQRNLAKQNKCVRCGSSVSGTKCCASCNLRLKETREQEKDLVFEHYGRECSCCRETRKEFLSVDHVNNDGAEHRKTMKTSYIYKWLVKNKFPTGFQILCFNCNIAKGIYGSCPHKAEELANRHGLR